MRSTNRSRPCGVYRAFLWMFIRGSGLGCRWWATNSFSGQPRMNSPVLSRRLLAQEIDQQRDDLLRLLLLHPVPGAVEQLAADHTGADLLRAFESPRRLVDAPVARAADEDRWHVDRAPGK